MSFQSVPCDQRRSPDIFCDISPLAWGGVRGGVKFTSQKGAAVGKNAIP